MVSCYFPVAGIVLVSAHALVPTAAPTHDAYIENGLPWSPEYGDYIPNAIAPGGDHDDDGSALGGFRDDGHDDAEQ